MKAIFLLSVMLFSCGCANESEKYERISRLRDAYAHRENAYVERVLSSASPTELVEYFPASVNYYINKYREGDDASLSKALQIARGAEQRLDDKSIYGRDARSYIRIINSMQGEDVTFSGVCKNPVMSACDCRMTVFLDSFHLFGAGPSMYADNEMALWISELESDSCDVSRYPFSLYEAILKYETGVTNSPSVIESFMNGDLQSSVVNHVCSLRSRYFDYRASRIAKLENAGTFTCAEEFRD